MDGLENYAATILELLREINRQVSADLPNLKIHRVSQLSMRLRRRWHLKLAEYHWINASIPDQMAYM